MRVMTVNGTQQGTVVTTQIHHATCRGPIVALYHGLGLPGGHLLDKGIGVLQRRWILCIIVFWRRAIVTQYKGSDLVVVYHQRIAKGTPSIPQRFLHPVLKHAHHTLVEQHFTKRTCETVFLLLHQNGVTNSVVSILPGFQHTHSDP